MKRCSAKPYDGKDKYIFISYCHKDKAQVFPIIEQLAKDGYRVWYDEGIDPGSEWPEIIASHLNESAVCIAFLSQNSLKSHNCKREINFALLKKKAFISVVIEEVQMSLGMEMQLSATQAIFRYKLSTEPEFFKKLYEAKMLVQCLGAPDPSIVVSCPDDYQGTSSQNNLGRKSFSDEWFLGGMQETGKEENHDKPIDQLQEPESVASAETNQATAEQPDSATSADKNTTIEKDVTVLIESDDCEAEQLCCYLVYEKTQERISLSEGIFKIGRSDTQCNYVITGNSSVGRLHVILELDNGKCTVTDNHSKNGTFINDSPLSADTAMVLHDGDKLKIVNEQFTYHEEKIRCW